MVHEQFLDEYICFALMYMTYHIFLVLPIKHLINQDGKPTMPHKMANGNKYQVSNIRVIYFPFGLRKGTAQVDGKVLSMSHLS